MTSIIAVVLVVVLLATAIVAKRRDVKRAAFVGVLIVFLAAGALVALIYADPIAQSRMDEGVE